MDEYVRNILNEWGLASLENKFAENFIDKDAFNLLDDSTVKELIPELGLRLKFLKYLNLYKTPIVLFDQNNFDTSSECTSLNSTLSAISDSSFLIVENSEELTSTNTVPVTESTTETAIESNEPSPGPSPIKKQCLFNLSTLLQKSSTGQFIVATYKKDNILNRETRQKLVDIIVEDHLSNNLDTRISSHIFNYLAQAIVDLFPNECKESYFTTITTEKGKLGKGKLFAKFYNLRRKLKTVGLLKPKDQVPSTSVESQIYEPSKDEDDMILYLQSSSAPIKTVLEYWDKTYQARSKLKANTSAQEYLRKFPYLTASHGYELLEKDFTHEFWTYELKLFSNIDNFLNALHLFVNKSNQKNLIAECHSAFQLENNYDLKVLKLFSLIPKLIQTVTVAKTKSAQWKPTRIEILDSFILRISNIGDLHDAVERRKQKLSKFKQQLQPFVLIVGADDDTITEIYICIDDILYKVETPLKAIDVCFKIFHTLNLKYPIESERIWLIIQLCIYDMTTKYDKNFVDVVQITKDIRKFMSESECVP